MAEKILVVDDETQMAVAMERALCRAGYEVQTCHDAEGAMSALRRADFDAVFTDLRMPGTTGDELLRRIRVLDPQLPVVVVTAHGTVSSAVSCVRDGATDYLQKPFSPSALEQAARRALDQREKRELPAEDQEMVARDPATLEAISITRRAARSNATVLLEAESGAGKEVFARLIHRESPRARGPFVAINCAALPRELLEAELFGWVKGGHSRADRDRKGRFQQANGGTLLLDEIGEMSADLQARLLRVLQEQAVQPLGSDRDVPIDVRVVAATNRSLRDEVAAGRFREDLYYRLSVMPIPLPPLRERRLDIEPLALRFARQYVGADAELSDEALDALLSYDWPGNVRELQNVLQRASIMVDGSRIDAVHLAIDAMPMSPRAAAAALRDAPETPAKSGGLKQAEWDAVRRALETCSGNRTQAAQKLGISPRTLRHKLQKFREEGHPIEPGAARAR
ncbi:hypothetical protein ABI59_14470 [Acidobacteria bacterium Mor1]|nr:hypothetical protein ABI59_14470 [Acidobacteria bacterium Mor1]